MKLQPGDHFRRDMGEEKYLKVCAKLLEDGCPAGEEIGSNRNSDFFGWSNNTSFPNNSNKLYHAKADVFKGRLLTYEGVFPSTARESRPQNSDLPPVGTECRARYGNKDWRRGTIAAHVTNENGERQAIIQTLTRGWFARSFPEEFRALPTERELAIEAGNEALELVDPFGADRMLGILYDAGLLRTPEAANGR